MVAASEPARKGATIEQVLHRTGIARLGTLRRGFRYRCADGRAPSATDRARIAALVIPPAWRDVRIAASPRARVQAIGRDQRGRLQYRYHEAQVARRERDKLARILRLAGVLPRLRAGVEHDLRRRGLTRERVLAAMVRILGACMLRGGSAAYARENGSFGLATLRPEHVQTHGATIAFAFPGKSGKLHRCEMQDARVAGVVRELLRARTAEVFAYEAPGATAARGARAGRRLVDVRRRDLNAYLAALTGEPITAKDFRTWAGTLVCASHLARLAKAAGDSALRSRRTVNAALRATAAVLGNTPAVCRKSYVFGSILHAWEEGRTIPAAVAACEAVVGRDHPRLRRLERAVLGLLRDETRRPRDR